MNLVDEHVLFQTLMLRHFFYSGMILSLEKDMSAALHELRAAVDVS